MAGLTPAQRAFLTRDAYDEIWIGCPLPSQRTIGANLAGKGLGRMRGVGIMARFHMNDLGRMTREQLLIGTADRIIHGGKGADDEL